MDLTPEHRLREPRRMRVHRRDDLIGCLLSLVIPGAARSEIVAEVLTEQARDMAALRRESRIQRRRDQHLDDRLSGPSIHCRVEIGPVHVTKAWCHNDSGGEVMTTSM